LRRIVGEIGGVDAERDDRELRQYQFLYAKTILQVIGLRLQQAGDIVLDGGGRADQRIPRLNRCRQQFDDGIHGPCRRGGVRDAAQAPGGMPGNQPALPGVFANAGSGGV